MKKQELKQLIKECILEEGILGDTGKFIGKSFKNVGKGMGKLALKGAGILSSAAIITAAKAAGWGASEIERLGKELLQKSQKMKALEEQQKRLK
jgi:hypothetical protein